MDCCHVRRQKHLAKIYIKHKHRAINFVGYILLSATWWQVSDTHIYIYNSIRFFFNIYNYTLRIELFFIEFIRYPFQAFLLDVNLPAKIPPKFLLFNCDNAREFVRGSLVERMCFTISLPKKGIIAFYTFSCCWEALKRRC